MNYNYLGLLIVIMIIISSALALAFSFPIYNTYCISYSSRTLINESQTITQTYTYTGQAFTNIIQHSIMCKP